MLKKKKTIIVSFQCYIQIHEQELGILKITQINRKPIKIPKAI